MTSNKVMQQDYQLSDNVFFVQGKANVFFCLFVCLIFAVSPVFFENKKSIFSTYYFLNWKKNVLKFIIKAESSRQGVGTGHASSIFADSHYES